MRISTLFVLTALTAGCGLPASQTDGVTPHSRVSGTETSGYAYVAPDKREAVSEYDATVDAVWNATVDAYVALGIETVILESAGLVGNPRFEVTRRLAGERLSKYLRCGTDDTGMPAADSYRVRMDVRSRVTSLVDARARLETTIDATARDMSGTAADRVQCATTGVFEKRIADAVRTRLDGTD